VERRQFAQNAHEYLIEQVQFQNYNKTGDYNVQVSFKHPVKEIILSGEPKQVYLPTNAVKVAEYPVNGNSQIVTSIIPWGGATPYPFITQNKSGVISNNVSQTNTTFALVLNQIPRFTARNIKYFTRLQPWEVHTGSGSIIDTDCIGVYSFALQPEDHQPSGTCNFSRIDSVRFISTGSSSSETLSSLDIYAINYNILRIMSGMGAVAFAS
jgi:hypothetical protein